jgi:predicted RNA binding protein YcfA (HicA-like mRNA interferase family)
MKKIDLERELKKLGWWFKRHGGNHDYWTNGQVHESVPRHNEINENLARKIIKTARNNPPKK